jgi:hypothetical protein
MFIRSLWKTSELKPHLEACVSLSSVVQFPLFLVTLISFIVIALLFISETYSYMRVEIFEELFVDSTAADNRVDIHFDLTFSNLPCTFLTIDVMDISGLNMHDVKDSIYKLRLDDKGSNISDPIRQGINVNASEEAKPTTKEALCGSCYGA